MAYSKLIFYNQIQYLALTLMAGKIFSFYLRHHLSQLQVVQMDVLIIGGCDRFWYGGCEPGKNHFDSQEKREKILKKSRSPV